MLNILLDSGCSYKAMIVTHNNVSRLLDKPIFISFVISYFELANWAFRIFLLAQCSDDVVVFDVQRISHLNSMCSPSRH